MTESMHYWHFSCLLKINQLTTVLSSCKLLWIKDVHMYSYSDDQSRKGWYTFILFWLVIHMDIWCICLSLLIHLQSTSVHQCLFALQFHLKCNALWVIWDTNSPFRWSFFQNIGDIINNSTVLFFLIIYFNNRHMS